MDPAVGRTMALARCGGHLGALENRCPHQGGPLGEGSIEKGRTVSDVLVETLVAFGITHVFGMAGHSNLRFADAMRRAEERGELTYVGSGMRARLRSRPARTASCAAVPFAS